MLRRVATLRTDVSDELFISRVTRILFTHACVCVCVCVCVLLKDAVSINGYMENGAEREVVG
jgi:hypothetical protein